MGVLFKNNASSTLDTAISASDLGLAVAYGDGTLFPTVGASEYYYMTIEATDGTYEVVKVTARSGDSMTIVRAQEGTTALAFTAGARCEIRMTNQGIVDKVADASNLTANSVTFDKIEQVAAAKVLGSIAGGDIAELSVTSVLDLIGSTQGQILYRGASSWSALGVGTSGQLLQSGGAAANPSWVTGIALTDGDKGSITVSGSGTVWTLDDAAVTLAKMANINQYELIGRSSASPGVPQAIATSADVYTMLGSANNAAIRSNIGLGSMATQASTAVAVTGGTIAGLTTLQGTAKLATNTSGTLALADADCICFMTGDVTLDGNVFSSPQAIIFYSGASARTIYSGTSMTLRLGGTSTTGDRTLAARTLAVGLVIGTNEIVIAGSGVT